ncbi:MAG TPA: hypothetical protein VFO27_16235 [Bryobacteraceae bacterium]|nr:hypothetical protein [Bryobacteraceae bacterium]
MNTRFWLADPAKPSVRQLLVTVEHQSGWAGVATVSPNGKTVALTVLPQGKRDPDHEAGLQMFDINKPQSRTLADGIDLRSTLVWSPDGAAVTYQRFDGSQQQLWSQPAIAQPATEFNAVQNGERIIPLALDEDGQVLEAHFGGRGVDLERIRAGKAPEQVQHLSDSSARNFALAPGDGRLAYLAVDRGNSDPVSRAYVSDLSGGAIKELPADWGEIVGVVWNANQELVAGSAGSTAGLRTEAGVRVPSPAVPGFLQPLSWSTSGKYLAVRSFSGTSGAQPGSARDALLTQKGKLILITDTLPVRFVGWATGASRNAGK